MDEINSNILGVRGTDIFITSITILAREARPQGKLVPLTYWRVRRLQGKLLRGLERAFKEEKVRK